MRKNANYLLDVVPFNIETEQTLWNSMYSDEVEELVSHWVQTT